MGPEPVSKPEMPKQFISVDKLHSLLQNTILRLPDYRHIVLVSNANHVRLLEQQLTEINEPLENKIQFTIILEPFARNTCSAICTVAQLFKDKNIIVLTVLIGVWMLAVLICYFIKD